jgi:5-methylcytosine-specific restriction endonuclease McrA
MADVLVLDANYRPVGFKPWWEAVKNIYEERADLIKADESGKTLHGGRNANGEIFEMGMPRVIRVRNAWTKRKRMAVPMTRRNVYLRDNGECQYTGRWEVQGGRKYWVECGEKLKTSEYTLDHVNPRVQGGISSWKNMVTSCVECNKAKAGRTPAEAGMRLRKAPVEPHVDDPRYTFKLHITKLRPEWKEWADWLYWNIELDK